MKNTKPMDIARAKEGEQMKAALMLLTCCVLLSGCLVYGSGKTNGYITTIENGIFWDVVFIRAELESSQTDGYVINKSNQQLKDQLQVLADKKQRVQLYFKKHIIAADEVVCYKILE